MNLKVGDKLIRKDYVTEVTAITENGFTIAQTDTFNGRVYSRTFPKDDSLKDVEYWTNRGWTYKEYEPEEEVL